MKNPLPALQPGDILLYAGPGFVSWAIRFRTWSDVEHVEIYMGHGISAASRNGIGVDLYALRREGLKYVRRPVEKFQQTLAASYAQARKGTPYGWLDLLKFYGLNVAPKGSGLICSQFADLLLRSGNVIAFSPDYDAGAVSPRDFQLTPAAQTIWKSSKL